MQAKTKLGDDAEVPAATLKRPKQVGIRSSGSAVTRLPSLSTTRAAIMLSTPIPQTPITGPYPPPRVSPTTPGRSDRARCRRSTRGRAESRRSLLVAPPATAAVRRRTVTSRICVRSITRP